MESIVIKRVGRHERAYPPSSTHIRVRCHLGNAAVRYVTDDGYLGVHVDTDPIARTEEIAADIVTAVSPGGRPLLDRLFAAVAQPATISVIIVEVAA